jgi:hypothetical protein
LPGNEEEDPELSLKPNAKRNTISYARKMVIAGPNIFLDLLYVNKETDLEVKLT